MRNRSSCSVGERRRDGALACNLQPCRMTGSAERCGTRQVMAENSERDVIQHLIEICSDGERGFRTAADQVHDPALRALFVELADERRRFTADLVPHLQRLGGQADNAWTGKGAMHRSWMTLLRLVPGEHDHAMVVEAERGERAALSAYDRALAGFLPLKVDWLVEAQREAVRKAHARIAAFEVRP
jgi:uncharacterized protein (TIGR02284 family)